MSPYQVNGKAVGFLAYLADLRERVAALEIALAEAEEEAMKLHRALIEADLLEKAQLAWKVIETARRVPQRLAR